MEVVEVVEVVEVAVGSNMAVEVEVPARRSSGIGLQHSRIATGKSFPLIFF